MYIYQSLDSSDSYVVTFNMWLHNKYLATYQSNVLTILDLLRNISHLQVNIASMYLHIRHCGGSSAERLRALCPRELPPPDWGLGPVPVATAETEPAGATSASKQGAVLWTELGHTHPLHCHASSRIQPAYNAVLMWSVSNVMLSGAGVHDCESPWRRWLWHPALSSSQQPPAGGSSDMESGGRCLYRQHYTYTAHIYTTLHIHSTYLHKLQVWNPMHCLKDGGEIANWSQQLA